MLPEKSFPIGCVLKCHFLLGLTRPPNQSIPDKSDSAITHAFDACTHAPRGHAGSGHGDAGDHYCWHSSERVGVDEARVGGARAAE